jgi:hypothetical protein
VKSINGLLLSEKKVDSSSSVLGWDRSQVRRLVRSLVFNDPNLDSEAANLRENVNIALRAVSSKDCVKLDIPLKDYLESKVVYNGTMISDEAILDLQSKLSADISLWDIEMETKKDWLSAKEESLEKAIRRCESLIKDSNDPEFREGIKNTISEYRQTVQDLKDELSDLTARCAEFSDKVAESGIDLKGTTVVNYLLGVGSNSSRSEEFVQIWDRCVGLRRTLIPESEKLLEEAEQDSREFDPQSLIHATSIDKLNREIGSIKAEIENFNFKKRESQSFFLLIKDVIAHKRFPLYRKEAEGVILRVFVPVDKALQQKATITYRDFFNLYWFNSSNPTVGGFNNLSLLVDENCLVNLDGNWIPRAIPEDLALNYAKAKKEKLKPNETVIHWRHLILSWNALFKQRKVALPKHMEVNYGVKYKRPSPLQPSKKVDPSQFSPALLEMQKQIEAIKAQSEKEIAALKAQIPSNTSESQVKTPVVPDSVPIPIKGNDAPKPSICLTCKQSFPSKNAMRRHTCSKPAVVIPSVVEKPIISKVSFSKAELDQLIKKGKIDPMRVATLKTIYRSEHCPTCKGEGWCYMSDAATKAGCASCYPETFIRGKTYEIYRKTDWYFKDVDQKFVTYKLRFAFKAGETSKVAYAHYNITDILYERELPNLNGTKCSVCDLPRGSDILSKKDECGCGYTYNPIQSPTMYFKCTEVQSSSSSWEVIGYEVSFLPFTSQPLEENQGENEGPTFPKFGVYQLVKNCPIDGKLTFLFKYPSQVGEIHIYCPKKDECEGHLDGSFLFHDDSLKLLTRLSHTCDPVCEDKSVLNVCPSCSYYHCSHSLCLLCSDCKVKKKPVTMNYDDQYRCVDCHETPVPTGTHTPVAPEIPVVPVIPTSHYCVDCKSQFGDPFSLAKHTCLSKGKNQGKKVCPYCSSSFTKSGIRKHKAKCTSKPVESSAEDDEYECFCPLTFLDVEERNAHSRECPFIIDCNSVNFPGFNVCDKRHSVKELILNTHKVETSSHQKQKKSKKADPSSAIVIVCPLCNAGVSRGDFKRHIDANCQPEVKPSSSSSSKKDESVCAWIKGGPCTSKKMTNSQALIDAGRKHAFCKSHTCSTFGCELIKDHAGPHKDPCIDPNVVIPDNVNTSQFYCAPCKKGFNSLNALEMHKSAKHTTQSEKKGKAPEANFECPNCQYSGSFTAVERHLKTCKPGGTKKGSKKSPDDVKDPTVKVGALLTDHQRDILKASLGLTTVPRWLKRAASANFNKALTDVQSGVLTSDNLNTWLNKANNRGLFGSVQKRWIALKSSKKFANVNLTYKPINAPEAALLAGWKLLRAEEVQANNGIPKKDQIHILPKPKGDATFGGLLPKPKKVKGQQNSNKPPSVLSNRGIKKPRKVSKVPKLPNVGTGYDVNTLFKMFVNFMSSVQTPLVV